MTSRERVLKALNFEEADRIAVDWAEEAEPIVTEMERIWEKFEKEIFSGLSKEEVDAYDRVNEKIKENTQRALKGRERF